MKVATEINSSRISGRGHGMEDMNRISLGVIVAAGALLLGAGLFVHGTDTNSSPAAEPRHHPVRPSRSFSPGKASETLSMSCRIPRKVKIGQTVLMNYVITSSMRGWIGFGAGLRAPGGKGDVRAELYADDTGEQPTTVADAHCGAVTVGV
ncbi:hypothetical protein ACFY36_16280 [Actinoplanes sp. NPDC000266]